MRTTGLITAAVAVGVVASSATSLAECRSGTKAPGFEAKALYEPARVVKSAELYQGKTTLLSFFAIWCRPCKEEIPELRVLSERYADRGFQAVLVSLDRDRKDVDAFLKVAGSGNLPVLWDGDRKIKDLYKVSQLPTNVIIEPDGCVSASWFGYLPAKLQELEARLAKLPKTAN